MERAMSEEWRIRAPPAQVMAVAGIVGFWLWLPRSSNGGSISINILVPLLLMWVAYSVLRYGRLRHGLEDEPPKLSGAHGGDSPWGVAFFLLLLLLLISYHPNW